MKRLGLSIILIVSAMTANAATVVPNLTYILGDHPDGNLTSLPDITYGLRLDDGSFSLFGSGGDGSEAARTFSTTQETAFVSLFWDNMGDMDDSNDIATITGTLSRNSDNSIWNVTYTLTDITAVTDGFIAKSATGTLSNGGDIFALDGEAQTSPAIVVDGTSYTDLVFLALGDGHRLSGDTTSEVIRGWLLPTGPTEDWLTTLTPVPLPAAVWLFGTALAGLIGFSRKTS